MNSHWPKVLAAIVAGVLILGVLFRFTSRGSAAAAGEDVVYVCGETGQVVVAALQATPAINSATGKPTLLRGVYCPKCERWYATPPPEHAAGNPKALTCRIHQILMTTDGPMPAANTPEVDDSKP